MAILIAAYSMVDKVGVMRSHAAAYALALFAWNAAIMTPYVVMQRGGRQIRGVWHRRRWVLVMSGLCSVGAYLLVLIAMRLTQVSYTAALRESSVIFGAFLGWRVLGEPFGGQRITASTVVSLGLIILALAMRG